jgi:transcriptional regulator with XRE-family HTH domain
MDYYTFSDASIAAELGQRLKRLRQRRDYTRKELADAIGEPVKVITALEKGKGTLAVFIAVLRELHAFDQFDRFLMETRVRALELSDPRQPTVGTVMFRRRKTDFKTP